MSEEPITAWMENHDPWFWSAVFLASLLAGVIYYTSRPRKRLFWPLPWTNRIRTTLICLVCIACSGSFVFQTYFRVFSCRVSHIYYQENLSLMFSTMAILDRHQIANWPEFATLLNVVRAEVVLLHYATKDGVNAWDHDTDLSVVYPSEENGLQKLMDLLTMELTLERGRQVKMSYHSDRELVQISVVGRPGPHTDIWLWKPHKDSSGREYLYNVDYSVHFPYRPLEYIFPLERVFFISQNISIPRQAHPVCKLEYSPHSNSYMTASVFVRDCFHNFFNLRFLYS